VLGVCAKYNIAILFQYCRSSLFVAAALFA
jgi:hypothetical protein